MRGASNAAIGETIRQTDAAFLCSPFKAQIMLQLQPTPKFSESVRCSLDDIVNNIDDFYNDFSKGGWIGYAELMQPQNNYYGVALQVSANLNEQSAKAVDAASKEVQAGSGFLSVKKCKGGGTKNPSPKDIDELGLMKDFQGNYCKEENLENTTPGNIVGAAVANAVTADSQWAANIQSYTAALINALISRLTKEGLSLMFDSNSSEVNSSAGYTAPYNNIIASTFGSNQSSMVESVKMFLDGWKDILRKYKMAFASNSEVISALEAIKAKSCKIIDEPDKDNILKALGVNSVDEALSKSNAAQGGLKAKIDSFELLILEASSTIDRINGFYLNITSTSTLPMSATSTVSTTSTLGNPNTVVKVQAVYSGFMNKYNNQHYLNPILLNNAGGNKEVDGEVEDKAKKAGLAREALRACVSAP